MSREVEKFWYLVSLDLAIVGHVPLVLQIDQISYLGFCNTVV
jgi:hypothetical protein